MKKARNSADQLLGWTAIHVKDRSYGSGLVIGESVHEGRHLVKVQWSGSNGASHTWHDVDSMELTFKWSTTKSKGN